MTTQDLLDRAQSIIDEIRSDAITPARMGELLRDIIALSDKRDVDLTSLFDGMIYNVSQITGNYGLSASTAREAVPFNKRRLAQMVVYRTAQGTVAEMYNSSNIDGWKDQWNWITLAPVSRVSYLEAKLPIDRTNKIPGSNGETREVQTLRYVDPADVIHEIGIDQEGVPFVHSSGVYNRLVKDVELQETNESIRNLRIDIFDNTINKETLTDGSENVVLIVNDDADRTAGIGVNSETGKAFILKGTGENRSEEDLATEDFVNKRELEIKKEIGYVREQLQNTVPKDSREDGSSDRYIYNEDDGGYVSVLGVESKTGKVFSGRGWNPTSKPKNYLATEEFVNNLVYLGRDAQTDTNFVFIKTGKSASGKWAKLGVDSNGNATVSINKDGQNEVSIPLATKQNVDASIQVVVDKTAQLEQNLNNKTAQLERESKLISVKDSLYPAIRGKYSEWFTIDEINGTVIFNTLGLLLPFSNARYVYLRNPLKIQFDNVNEFQVAYFDLPNNFNSPIGVLDVIQSMVTVMPFSDSIKTEHLNSRVVLFYYDRIRKRMSSPLFDVSLLKESYENTKTKVSLIESTTNELKIKTEDTYFLLNKQISTLSKVVSGTLDKEFNFRSEYSSGYWSQNTETKISEIIQYNGYYSIPTLIDVQEGDYLYLEGWGSSNTSSTLAYAAYNNDNLPYNGVSSRINFNVALINDFEIGYHVFKIPTGCTKIGLSVKSTSAKLYLVNATIKSPNSVGIVINKEFLSRINSETNLAKIFSTPTDFKIIESVYLKKYWHQDEVTKKAKLIDYTLTDTPYNAFKELIPVKEGDILSLLNWGLGTDYAGTKLAYSAYNNDNLPYNDTDSRINFEDAYFTDKLGRNYKFVIPKGCSRIGVSCQATIDNIESAMCVIEGDEEFNEKFKADILALIPSSDKTSDLSAQFYQKGASPKSISKKKAILCAGQSNADGRVPIAQLPSYIQFPLNKCNYANSWGATSFDPMQAPTLWAFDTIVYNQMSVVDAEDIFVIKYAVGGTSIDKDGATTSHWTALYEYLNTGDVSLLKRFETMIRKLTELHGSNFDIRAMLWHQGEGDYSSGPASRYYDNLKYMIAYIRGVVGNQRLPFICGTLSTKSTQYNKLVNDAYRKLASEDPYFYLCDLDNATLLDPYHFDATWTEKFGKMAYNFLVDAGVAKGGKITV